MDHWSGEALFDAVPPGTLKGESTNLYLGEPQAHLRIKRDFPDVRPIAVLLDPIDRAHVGEEGKRFAKRLPGQVFSR